MEYTEEQKNLIAQAKLEERSDILNIIQSFIRTRVAEDGEEISEIKVPPNHLKTIILARGDAETFKLSEKK